MKFQVNINNSNITVLFEKSKKMKRCYIRILDASTVQIKSHWYYTLEDAKALVEQKKPWLEKHIIQLQAKQLKNSEFYFLGTVCLFEDFDIDEQMIDAFYKKKAQEILPVIVEKYAQKMNLFPTALKFRKTKSRWGSCSFTNIINLSTNLMKLPFSCVDYIVIHELAHIKHKNHSKVFWDFVEEYCPNYKEEEKKIKYF